MGSDIKGCSCPYCKSGLRTKHGSLIAKRARKKFRKIVKKCLRNGNFDSVPDKTGRKYTD
jgi:hypothetical protein